MSQWAAARIFARRLTGVAFLSYIKEGQSVMRRARQEHAEAAASLIGWSHGIANRPRKERTIVARTTTTLGRVLHAAGKLGGDTPAWHNLLAYLQSCYAGHSRPFDFEAACAALARLSEEEQHALIAWVVYLEEARIGPRRRPA